MTAISIEFSGRPAAGPVVLNVALVAKDEALVDLPSALIDEAARQRFKGAIGESAWVGDSPGVFLAVIGIGDAAHASGLRRAAYYAVECARSLKVDSLQVSLSCDISDEAVAFLAQGLRLSTWSFDQYKKAKDPETSPPELREVLVVGDIARANAFARGLVLADAVCFARDLVNEHPGVCTPTWLAEQARERALSLGLEVQVFDEKELEARGFLLHLAVARGSSQPARFLHAVYRPSGPVERKVALVGKGVTFDSGGYSIKPSSSMVDMHMDMGGAAAVIGAMDAIGHAKPEGVEVHFIAPMAENLISGNAYKINEIIRGYNGTTVEIIDTDAEGRLLLADALAYAAEQGVDEIVDLATLTGACIVGLGMETAGLFSSSDRLSEALRDAAREADEAVWPLPLVERMNDKLKSRVADIKNLGPRWGGAVSAALFLKRFVGDTPWAHLDIAGPAMAESAWETLNAGGTGFGVLLLAQYLGVRAE